MFIEYFMDIFLDVLIKIQFIKVFNVKYVWNDWNVQNVWYVQYVWYVRRKFLFDEDIKNIILFKIFIFYSLFRFW